MLATILIGFTILLMLLNLYYFFTNQQHKESYIHTSLFTKLFLIMTVVTFGFALIYFLLAFNIDVLRLNDESGRKVGEDFWDYLYFSGVTMLSIGYGDMVPVGYARFFCRYPSCLGIIAAVGLLCKSI